MFFYAFIILVAAQRLVELLYAKRNEKWMKAKGAEEFGQGHYPFMVLMHITFFVALMVEVSIKQPTIHPLWPLLLVLFLGLQWMRVWTIRTLGRYWNTKIIVLKGEKVVVKGPFRLLKHPNYFVVTTELIVIPLMFQAYWTLMIYFFLNQLILMIRLNEEEKALEQLTNYEEAFAKR
ncbi:isoprenylcysteine carboxyl methyltransferase family protein [Bacillus sp. FJAT-42315]|uniref:isoprenylcysteine carboxyl methyltransferase family protein n=1 Tax=Bacillus sp. FJAT-42315 TaxID=2014077 RepID=UPI000C23F5DB|nr:isoprenylcysteine carboxylmethyltransferase family protein [Bacillus sp. FJAT-42315]